ncbi:MAG: sialate O-acetylesterase, partial [Chitinophagaceae bacterium]
GLLQKHLNVPVGLVQIAVGGSPTESWIDRNSMEQDPLLVNELTNWRNSDFYQPWARERADINLRAAKNPGQRHPFDPAYNFESAISLWTEYRIQGVIWYQGESNTHNPELHEKLFPLLVNSWRRRWGYEFSFYYVQLSSLNRPSWPAFRFSQLQMHHKIPRSGMAVSSDAGDSTDVHPRRKKEVGERLARLALHFTYGKKDIVPNGPVALKAERQDDKLVISFQTDGKLKTADGSHLRGFKWRNSKGVENQSRAYIKDNMVIIPLDNNDKPVELLYGWEPYTNANLINEAGLPASTFRLKIN